MSAAPQFRILWPDEGPAGARRRRSETEDPRAAWTWGEFFDNWFLPNVLRTKDASEGTVDLYRDTLRYWAAITGNPAIGDTSDEGSLFAQELPKWGYSRRGMRRGESQRIGPRSQYPAFLQLSPTTVSAHLSRMATLFTASAGQRMKAGDRRAAIIPQPPFLPTESAEEGTKPPFPLELARRIFEATDQMTRPTLPTGWSCPQWWKMRIGLFYYTGLRAGTVVALRRRLVTHVQGEWRLNVPAELVQKTGKPIKMALHPHLAELIAAAPAADPNDPDELLIPKGCGYRHFLTLHGVLLELAGLTDQERQSPHAWRRTHDVELGKLGLPAAEEIARQALDHSSFRTTQESYVGDVLVNYLRLRLPRLG